MSKSRIIALSFWVFVLAFFVFLLTGMPEPGVKVKADTATTSATIGNATPTVGSISVGSVSLSEGITVAATSSATVSDSNGYQDLDSVTAVFYDASATNSSCTADNNDCYAGIGCTTSSCSGTDCTASCSTNVWYYANGAAVANWKWTLSAGDGTATGTNTSASTTISQLVALDVTATIAYGTVALSATSSEKTTTVTNTGNKNGLDAQVSSAAAMSCDIGTIAQSYQHYSTTTGFEWAAGVALTNSGVAVGMSIAQRTNGTTTDDVYWRLQTPASGVSGDCSGTDTFTAN